MKDSELNAMQMAYLRGDLIPENLVGNAEELCLQRPTSKAMFAYATVLRQSKKKGFKEKALLALEATCEEHITSESGLTVDLLLLLTLLPENVLEQSESFKRLAYSAIQSIHSVVRANATRLIFRFAKAGDEESRLWLKNTATDSNLNVKTNAAVLLSKLEGTFS